MVTGPAACAAPGPAGGQAIPLRAPAGVRIGIVTIFFTILLVLCSILIAVFGIYTVVRLLSNEPPFS